MKESSLVLQTQDRLAPLLSLSRPGRARVNLGGGADQTAGRIPLYYRRGNRTSLWKTLRIENLRPAPPGETVVQVIAEYPGGREVRIILRCGGRQESHTFRLPSRFPLPGSAGPAQGPRVSRLLRVLPPVLLLLAAGGFLLFRFPQERPNRSSPAAALLPPLAAPAESSPAVGEAPPSGNPSPIPGGAAPEADSETPKIPGETPEEAPPGLGALPGVPEAPAPGALSVIYFLPEDAALIPATAARLKDLAAALEALPGEGGVLELTGHCALYGTEESRVELSRRRAENAAAFLKNQGLNWTFRISAEGGRRPVTLDPDRQELNRRVEIRRRP